jgi:hypothetical protein
MCHESIRGALAIVKHFNNNYCTYYQHGSNIIVVFSGFKISESFENEILALQKNMWVEVIKVIKPFLQFLENF